MKERHELWEPANGQTDRERFAQVDRAIVGKPPDGWRTWSDYDAAARQDSASKDAPRIQESIADMEARIELDVQQDAQKQSGKAIAFYRKELDSLNSRLAAVLNLIKEKPELYQGADKNLLRAIQETRRELAIALQQNREATEKLKGAERDYQARQAG